MQHRQYTSTSQRGFQPPALNSVLILILVNVVCFLLVQRIIPWWELALSTYGLKQFKIWQLVTYMFLHANIMHILFNMYGLYLFGRYVLSSLGTRRFLTLYFLSGIVGAGLWLLFNWGSRSPVLGASGAVFGVMMAAAMLYPNMRLILLFPPIPITLKTFVAIYAGIEIFSELTNTQGGVAHLAHLGGFLAAFVYIRYISGESLGEIVTSPLHRFPLLGDVFRKSQQHGQRSGQRRNVIPLDPRRRKSQTNRKTYDEIMKEIEEIEREEKRKRRDDFL